MSQYARVGDLTGPSILRPAAIRNPGVIWPLVLSALAWGVLALLAGNSGGLALPLGDGPGIAGRVRTAIEAGFHNSRPDRLALGWGAMAMAMMLPLALPHLSVLCARTYPARRGQVLAAALVGYLGVWLVLGLPGLLIILSMHALGDAIGWPLLLPVLAYGTAVLWCLSPLRRRALRRCHRVPVLFGDPAEHRRLALKYGVRLGGLCAVVCLPVMLAPMLTRQGLVAMALVTHILLSERLMTQAEPRHVAISVAMLGVLAGLVAIAQ